MKSPGRTATCRGYSFINATLQIAWQTANYDVDYDLILFHRSAVTKVV